MNNEELKGTKKKGKIKENDVRYMRVIRYMVID